MISLIRFEVTLEARERDFFFCVGESRRLVVPTGAVADALGSGAGGGDAALEEARDSVSGVAGRLAGLLLLLKKPFAWSLEGSMGVGSEMQMGGGTPGEPSEFLLTLEGRLMVMSRAGGLPPEMVLEWGLPRFVLAASTFKESVDMMKFKNNQERKRKEMLNELPHV